MPEQIQQALTRAQAEELLRTIPVTYVRSYLRSVATPRGVSPIAAVQAQTVAQVTNIAPVVPLVIDFTLGADPEFEFRNAAGDRGLRANEYLRHAGRLGCDGHSSTGEMRPGPGNADEVFNNIKAIIRSARAVSLRHNNMQMIAGCGISQQLGGHIHFGGLMETSLMVDCLGILIALPLRTISDAEHRRSYGNLTDTRHQPHGWEYRAPCSWLSHPALTYGVLVISQYVAYRAKHGMDMLNTHEALAIWVDLHDHGHAEAIRKFKRVIDAMIANSSRMEQVEVFQAWARTINPASRSGSTASRTAVASPNAAPTKVKLIVAPGIGLDALRGLSINGHQFSTWRRRSRLEYNGTTIREINIVVDPEVNAQPRITVPQSIRSSWCSSGTTRRGNTFEGAFIYTQTVNDNTIMLNQAYLDSKTADEMAASLNVLRTELSRSLSMTLTPITTVACDTVPTVTTPETPAPVASVNPVIALIENA